MEARRAHEERCAFKAKRENANDVRVSVVVYMTMEAKRAKKR